MDKRGKERMDVRKTSNRTGTLMCVCVSFVYCSRKSMREKRVTFECNLIKPTDYACTKIVLLNRETPL